MTTAKGLPARYDVPLRQGFDQAIGERLAAGGRVLDIGSGRHPALARHDRPEGMVYVGLDLSKAELGEAGEGAYDEMLEADATQFQPELAESFDLVVSWQVLEHVADMEATLENVRNYLKPGGRFVAQFSGAWSAFGIINRILPDRIGAKVVDRTMRRTENNIPVFPAFYDRCTARALAPLLATWASYRLTPIFFGATYFNFLPPARRVYLAYENAIDRRRAENLATHYLLVAER
jgi:SAM-dependent methyltransferase